MCKKDNSICLLEIDIVGAKRLKELDIGVEFIAIVPKSYEILKERLINRGTDSIEVIEKRISIGKKELEEINSMEFIKYKVINDEIESSYEQLKEVLKKVFPNTFACKH